MKVHTATLAGGDNNQDRVFITDNAVVVLDGASGFGPVDVDPGLYAETVGAATADQLTQLRDRSIADMVATAIAHAVQKLGLSPGRSPSCTVSALRVRPGVVDLYALGDSPIYYGCGEIGHVLADRRPAAVAPQIRERYVSRLRAGHGFGPAHRASLAALQRMQRATRNRDGGYWIAETLPAAASHAITATHPQEMLTWAVLATDGAADLVNHAGPSWADISRRDSDQLAALLDRLHHWESVVDGGGAQLPRAKQHDDKTIAAIRDVR